MFYGRFAPPGGGPETDEIPYNTIKRPARINERIALFAGDPPKTRVPARFYNGNIVKRVVFRAQGRENIVKRVVCRDRARESCVKRFVLTDLRVQNPRFGRIGVPKLAFS